MSSSVQTLPVVSESSDHPNDTPCVSSGFLTPTLFNQEIIDFFANANIGPLVHGTFLEKATFDGGIKLVPNVKSLQPSEERLNDVLDFTKPEVNGQANPLYRILNAGSLIPLFALHAYYTQMHHPNDATRLSAPHEIRQYLRQTMIDVIERDAARILDTHSDNHYVVEQVNEARQRLIDSIDNPDNIDPLLGQIRGNIEDPEHILDTIFNPNYFLYAHFSKFIASTRGPSPTHENISQINIGVRQQQDSIALARAYKNKIQTAR